MKIAILGGGGCFALNFARYLHARQIDCFGIGRSGPKAAPFWLSPPGYRFHAMHIGKHLESVMAVLDTERPDMVVNYAAQGEGAASFGANAADFYQTNTVALVRLTHELYKRDYLRRFIQIGTSELYGSVDKPSKETDELKPTSPYAISKAAFDQHLNSLHRLTGFPYNIVRPSNCYTEGQQLYRVIPKAIVCALSGKKLPLHGGGMAQKSYLHANDLSQAVLGVAEKAPIGYTYNVGPMSPITIKAVVTHVAEACGVSYEELVDDVPDRAGQDGRYWLDSTDIARDTGWTQTIGLPNGIARMVDWVRTYPQVLTMTTAYEHRQ